MTRPRTRFAVVSTAAALVVSLLPSVAAAASTTPARRLRSDVSRLVSAEHAYGRTHHKVGKRVGLHPGTSATVSGVRIKARSTQFIVVDRSTRRHAAGFCAAIYDSSVDRNGRFAYYDSVLKSTSLTATTFKIGGACRSKKSAQADLRHTMLADVRNADSTLQTAIESPNPKDNPPAGTALHLVATHAKPARVTANGRFTVTAATGDTVTITVKPRVYCISVRNPKATIAQHAYHYDINTGYIYTGAKCRSI